MAERGQASGGHGIAFVVITLAIVLAVVADTFGYVAGVNPAGYKVSVFADAARGWGPVLMGGVLVASVVLPLLVIAYRKRKANRRETHD